MSTRRGPKGGQPTKGWAAPLYDVTKGSGRDWRQKSSYDPILDRDEPTEWAWEFLRRNPAYQAAWAAFDRHEHRETVRAPTWRDHPARMEAGLLRGLAAHRLAWRMEGGLFDPRLELQAFVAGAGPVFFASFGSIHSGTMSTEMMPTPTLPQVAVTVDLSLEVEAQVEHLSKLLRAAQRAMVEAGVLDRPQRIGSAPIPAQRIRYLRILDADAAGADPREVARLIYGPRHRRDALRLDRMRARRLCRPAGYGGFLVPVIPTFVHDRGAAAQ